MPDVTQLLDAAAAGDADGDTPYTIVIGAALGSDPEYAGLDPTDLPLVNVDHDRSGFLYYMNSTSDSLYRTRPNGSQLETVIDLRATFGATVDYAPNSITVDEASGKLYWADSTARAIYRANLDGSGAEAVLQFPTGLIQGLVLDPSTDKLYWSDTSAGAQKIRRANLNGTTVEDVVAGTRASSVAVDAAAGKLYWAESASGIGYVRRAGLDGSNAETLWSGGVSSAASGLALDVAGGKVYWSDQTQKLIYRADFDGSAAEVLVNDGAYSVYSGVFSVRLDVAAGKMYWTDAATGALGIYRANLDGSNVALLAPGKANGPAIVHPTAGASVTNRTGLVTTEGGAGASFRVVLNTQPTANVTIPVSSSDATEGTVPVTSLTFTPDNWYVSQTVTISSADDALVDGNVSYTIALGTTSSTDPAYNGLDPADASVTSTDNDYTKFFVVDDASANRTYQYGAPGNGLDHPLLNSGNTAPRGAASTAAGDKVWVVDANKKVYVYSAAGALLGSWTAGSLDKNAAVEGITVWGNDVWLVDAKLDRVYRYAGAAGALSGTKNATSSFQLHADNISPKDLVTDGTSIWVVDDQVLDRVYKYTVSGTYVGRWDIDTANSKPTGITLDPANPKHLWVADSGTDRVYQYTDAVARTSGVQAAATSYALAAGNTNPQGIADPPPADPVGGAAEVAAAVAPVSNRAAPGSNAAASFAAPPTRSVTPAQPGRAKAWAQPPLAWLAPDEYDFAPIDVSVPVTKAKRK